MRPARDGIDKLIHERRYVATVAIQKYNDLAFGRKSANARGARASVTAGRGYHSRGSSTRTLGCAIGAAIVDDDDVIRHTGRETFAHDPGDRCLLIKSWDNGRHVAHRNTSHAAVK
jgi:hypothetical protein